MEPETSAVYVVPMHYHCTDHEIHRVHNSGEELPLTAQTSDTCLPGNLNHRLERVSASML